MDTPTQPDTNDLMEPQAPQPRKLRWNSQEDQALRAFVQQFGTQSWSKCSRVIGSRSAKQCRERWINVLAPGISKTPWTDTEDKQITALFHKYGTQWTKIAAFVNGRTPDLIKNRYYGKLKKQIEQSKALDVEPVMPTVEESNTTDEILKLLHTAETLESNFRRIEEEVHFLESIIGLPSENSS